jgi:hypothetical protein
MASSSIIIILIASMNDLQEHMNDYVLIIVQFAAGSISQKEDSLILPEMCSPCYGTLILTVSVAVLPYICTGETLGSVSVEPPVVLTEEFRNFSTSRRRKYGRVS